MLKKLFIFTIYPILLTMQDAIKFELDYRSLNLQVKNQLDSNSCISQTISTLVEAYFRRHPNDNTNSLSWSGFDIYYCHLNEGYERRMFRFALRKLLGQPIASTECWENVEKSTGKKDKDICPLVKNCSLPFAVIEDYGTIEKPTTKLIMDGLANYGPLGIIHRVEDSFKFHGFSKFDKTVVYHATEEKRNSKRKIISDLRSGLLPWHAQVLMGYGYENGELFWILQNSFGTSRGEQGYFYVGENELNFMDFNLWYIEKASLGNKPIDVEGKKSFLRVAKGAFS